MNRPCWVGGELQPKIRVLASLKNPPVSPLRKVGKFVKLVLIISYGQFNGIGIKLNLRRPRDFPFSHWEKVPRSGG